MKLITRLPHTAKEMNNSIFGWDIFRCRDYSNLDGMVENLSDVKNVKSIFGYTIIIAINLKVVRLKFFKRMFLRTS